MRNVVGVGYVSLPRALQFARSGAKVVGLDIDSAKVKLKTATFAGRLRKGSPVGRPCEPLQGHSRRSLCWAPTTHEPRL
jgi:hypothetical protein